MYIQGHFRNYWNFCLFSSQNHSIIAFTRLFIYLFCLCVCVSLFGGLHSAKSECRLFRIKTSVKSLDVTQVSAAPKSQAHHTLNSELMFGCHLFRNHFLLSDFFIHTFSSVIPYRAMTPRLGSHSLGSDGDWIVELREWALLSHDMLTKVDELRWF